ncbi:MAG: type II restriction endonuclease [Dehalococcoidia bacterium]|jgi:hypothetical protein
MKDFDLRTVLVNAFNKIGVQWHIKGVVDDKGQLYTISNDTKLISKIFELVTYPVIIPILEPYIERWEIEEKQNIYPDLTLMLPGPVPNKIAIDIKSTFRRGGDRGGFTLGSYTAYIRSPYTKNISYPYTDYRQHWIIGYIYSRVDGVKKPEVTSIDKLHEVEAAIDDIEVLVHEKWQLASDRPGSGNTANIGSVNSIDALKKGKGVFTRFGEHGKDIFEDYWRNFDRFTPRKYNDLEGYLNWKKRIT